MTTQKATHFRWIVIGLIFLITIVNYVDRASISYAIEDMATLFQFDADQKGYILGAFGIGYVVTTFLGGIAVDHYGARITLIISVVFWAFSLFLTGLATGFAMAFTARVLLGLAEGPNFPAMTRAVGDWLPKNERAVALSYSLMAVPIALAMGGPIVSQLVIHFEWRMMFFILAGVALIWLPFWWIYFRDFPEKSSHVNEQELHVIREGLVDKAFDAKAIHHERKNIQQLWRFLFTNPTLLANYWSFFVFGYFLFFFMTWLPSYLTHHYHMNLAKIGLFSIMPWTLAAVLMWVVGHLADYILKKTDNHRWSRSYPIMISQLIAAVCVIPIVLVHNEILAMLFISLAVGFSMSSNATFYATNIDVAKERAGTALGIMDAGFALSGFAAPVITGWTISITGNFTTAFLLLTVLALSSVIIVYFFHNPDSATRLSDFRSG